MGRRNPALLLAVVGALLGGVLLRPVPSDPDTTFSSAAYFGTASLFAAWAVSVVCWGRFLAALCRLESLALAEHACIGILGYSLVSTLLLHLGLAGFGASPLFLVLLLAGPAGDFLLGAPARPPVKFPGFTGFALGALLAAAIGLRVYQASGLLFMPDPFFYHLLGPRYWAEAGGFSCPWIYPLMLQCSYWEALLAWPNAVLGGPQGGGLIEVQYFGQWLHAVFGYGACGLALYGVLAHFEPSRRWRAAAVFAAISTGTFGWVAPLAKNDWGIAFFVISALGFQLRGNWFLAGMLVGAAFVMKLTTALVVAPLAAFLVLGERSRSGARVAARAAGWAALGAAVTALPMLVRNWACVGNPFFPALSSVFDSPWTTETLRKVVDHSATMPSHRWFPVLLERLAFLARRDLFVLLYVPACAAVAYWVPLAGWRKLVIAAPLVMLAVFFRVVGEPPGVVDDSTLHLRYLGPALLLSSSFAVLGLRWLLERAGAKPAALAAALGLVVAWSGVQHFSFHLAGGASGNEAVRLRTQLGGDSSAWLRMNARPEELVVFLGDTRFYHVSHLNFASVTHTPYLDWINLHVRDTGKLIRKLRELGVKYLVETHHYETRYWSYAAIFIEPAAWQHPEAVAFAGDRSMVIDLERLYGEVFQACPQFFPRGPAAF